MKHPLTIDGSASVEESIDGRAEPAMPRVAFTGLDFLAFGWSVYYVLFFFVGQNVLYRDIVIWGAGPLLAVGSLVTLAATKDGIRAVLPLALFAAFVLWTMLGVGLAVDSDAFVYHLRRISQNLLMFACIVLVVRRTGRLTPFLLAMLLTGILNGVAGSDVEVDQSALTSRQHVQAQGLTENPNALAFLAALGILGGLGLLRVFRSWILRGAVAMAMVYATAVAVAAASRGAFLSLALAFGVWPVLCYRKQLLGTPVRVLAIVATGAILAFGTVFVLENTYLGERISRTEELEGGEEMRSTLAREAIDVFVEQPISGVGIGQFPYISRYGREPHGDYTEPPGNHGMCWVWAILLVIHRGSVASPARARAHVGSRDVRATRLCPTVDNRASFGWFLSAKFLDRGMHIRLGRRAWNFRACVARSGAWRRAENGERLMCGICGLVQADGSDRLAERVRRMTRLAAHRGPDDEGVAVFASEGVQQLGADDVDVEERPWTVGLGHRRLSIVDLSPGGHQPMTDARGRYWIVYNGEIYNHVELRRELESAGERFVTRSDTEVILTAYRCWGRDALNRFNGMWAFAIYDRERRTILCARDRFGIKPFYYSVEPGRLAFASEIKQLVDAGVVRPQLNPDALADLLLWKLEAHSEHTFFSGIRSLPAGHLLEATREEIRRGVVTPVAFWRPRATAFSGEGAAIESFRELLDDSVRLRLRADVPVGVTLSGGLDSSSVTCLAGRARDGRQAEAFQAFTAVYADPGFSEQEYARQVAERARAEHILIRPDDGRLANDWERFVRTMEEPFTGFSYYSNWKVYETIRAHGVPVVLNGQGGDELLLGYERYRVPLLLSLAKSGAMGRALRELSFTARRSGLGWGRLASYMIYFGLPAVRRTRRKARVGAFLRPAFLRRAMQRGENVGRTLGRGNRQELQHSEFTSYQLPHLLRHEDRVSMAHAVEARVPLLDYRLFELVMGLPDDLLVRDGWSKYVLRQAMSGILPEEIRLRTTKMGFDTPTSRLLRDNRQFFERILARHHADRHVDVPAVEKAYAEGIVGEDVLSAVLTYLTWREVFNVEDA